MSSCSYHFYSCLVTTWDIVPFHLSIVVQEIEIVQMAFCWLYVLWMLQNYKSKIVKMYIQEKWFVEKIHYKETNAETLCKIWFVSFCKIWFVSFISWLPGSMSSRDEKWLCISLHDRGRYHISFRYDNGLRHERDIHTHWSILQFKGNWYFALVDTKYGNYKKWIEWINFSWTIFLSLTLPN